MKLNIDLKAEVNSRAGASGYLREAADAVLIQRGAPRWLLLKCPCGCGEEIPVNLDPRAGKAWRIYRESGARLTLFPSVWRDTGCKAHFIIWRSRILLFENNRTYGSAPHLRLEVRALASRVLDAWPVGRLVPYLEVADALGEIPWDVQEVCRYLVKSGALIEGREPQRGMFARRDATAGY